MACCICDLVIVLQLLIFSSVSFQSRRVVSLKLEVNVDDDDDDKTKEICHHHSFSTWVGNDKSENYAMGNVWMVRRWYGLWMFYVLSLKVFCVIFC